MGFPHAIEAGPDGGRALRISSPAAFAELTSRAGTALELADADPAVDFDRYLRVATELGDVVLGPPGTVPSDIFESDS